MTMSKWLCILLLFALPLPELDDDVLARGPFEVDSGAFFMLEEDDGRAAFHCDAILRNAGEGVRISRFRLQNASFNKFFSVLPGSPAVPMFYLHDSASDEPRDDLSLGVCPRLQGYALVFTVT